MERPTGPRQNPEFRKLWAGQTVSLLGSQVTLLALPLTAALTLDASATEMGILVAAGTAPVLVVGPLAGVWADRSRRRPLLIGADLGRAALLGTVPAAALTTGLRIEHLWAVALLAGAMTTLFDVAHASLLPSVVRREELVVGNSRLEVSRSGALIAGPAVAGLLVEWLTAPIAILVDAVSFLVSAMFIARIRAPERAPSKEARQGVWSEIRDGLRLVLRSPALSAMATSLCIFNLFSGMIGAVYVLFATRELGVSAAGLGLIYAVGSLSFPAGALAAGWVARRFGVGSAIVWGAGISDAGFLLLPLATGSPAVATALLIAARLVATLAGPVTAINQLSLRQAITPDQSLGRVNATVMTIALAAVPFGALLGGVLGDLLGLRAAVLVGALGIQLGFVRLLVSPVRRIRAAA
jgi:MFS family permease